MRAAAARLRRLERPRRRVSLASAAILTLIIFVAVIAAFPLAWMALTSLKTPAGDHADPAGVVSERPRVSTLTRRSRTSSSLGRSFLNSGVIATRHHIGDRRHEPHGRLRLRQIRVPEQGAAVRAPHRDDVPAPDRHPDPALSHRRLSRPRASASPAWSCPISPTLWRLPHAPVHHGRAGRIDRSRPARWRVRDSDRVLHRRPLRSSRPSPRSPCSRSSIIGTLPLALDGLAGQDGAYPDRRLRLAGCSATTAAP